MNLFIILPLLISFAFADSPPACKELGSIITSYETDLQKKTMKDCKDIKAEQLKLSSDQSDVTGLQGKVCNDLMTIEAEIENLKIQQVVLTGLDKLKKNVADSHEKTNSKDSKNQRVAGQKFATSLDVAQSVELLLHTYTEDGTPFIQKLKEIPENKRINNADLGNRVTELCKGLDKKQSNACNVSLFKPRQEAFVEINSLINQSKADKKQVEKWQNNLSIKKSKVAEGESDVYSFTQMKAELGSAFSQIDKDAPLNKEQIQAIQKLDTFTNANGFGFVEDIASLKDAAKSKIAFDTFSLHMGDAILRQQMDTQSRVSVLWENIKKEATTPLGKDAVACANAKNSHSSAVECIKALENQELALPADTKANLRRLIPALQHSVTYVERLEAASASCQTEFKSTKTLSSTCANTISKDTVQINKELHQLNLIKERIGSENIDNMRMRNFALEKWRSQKCDVEISTMDFCEETDLVSKEAFKTSGDIMNITVLFAPQSEAETHATQICEDDDREFTKNEERLCAFMNDTTKDITPAQTFVDSETAAPDGGYEKDMRRDAWIQGGSMVLQEALNSVFNNQTQYNPYQYNYAPYNYGSGNMGIADTILFNSRYYGAYGFYMPTLGYSPYQAFGPSFTSPSSSNFTPYATAGASNTASSASFFNFK